ncbi:MAG: response regulator transcription factor [Sphingobacteriaceae bacterium]|nr:response regulator transcription factor [Sphingobacteriaceae bacterium]
MNKVKILIVEDDENLRFLMVSRLVKEGFLVLESNEGLVAEDLILDLEPDLVLLDWMLPGKHGIDICKSVRAKGFNNLIIMMTAKSQDVDKIDAYNYGVSDYITKPFNMDVMVALLRNKLDFLENKQKENYDFADYKYIREEQIVYKDNFRLELTNIENKLLLCFLRNKNKIIKRDVLTIEVWGNHSQPNSRSVDMHIARLRKKLETENNNVENLFENIRGVGYRLNTIL